MLNYILPPIIIIFGVSALIVFLFRKVDKIPAQEFSLDEKQRIEDQKKAKKMFSLLGEISLKFLERMMHRSKLWSLKFHNVSNTWFQTIREKRQRGERIHKEMVEKKIQEELAVEGVDHAPIEKEVTTDRVSFQRSPRPMVSAGVTMPQRVKIKEKNKLEEALIKRIAINPKDIEAYERLGDYYLESENFQDSLECFKQVLHLSPTHQKAKMRIRRLERMK